MNKRRTLSAMGHNTGPLIDRIAVFLHRPENPSLTYTQYVIHKILIRKMTDSLVVCAVNWACKAL